MKITHHAFRNIIIKDFGDSFIEILSVRNFNDFIKKIDSISDLSTLYGYSDSEVEEEVKLGKYKFIGDLFEIFAESFFIQFSSDNRIGIFDYKPVPTSEDNGVDGFGKNVDGEPATVQVKFRSNPTYTLKERDIKQFPYQSIINYGIDFKKSNNMIVFTNCEGLNWYSESKVFGDKLRVINGRSISALIDNNEGFWNTFEKLVTQSVKEMGVDKLTQIFLEKLNKNK